MYMTKYPCVYMRGGTSKAVFFHEKVTVGKVIGAILVIVGVIIYANADGKVEDE